MQKPTNATIAEYHAALASRVKPTTTVHIFTAEHDPVAEVTAVTLPTAQVNFPGETAEVSRTLQLDMLDPTHALRLDSDSPDDGAVYADRFIRVTQTIESPSLSEPASVHVFTGPLVKFSRDGEVVRIEGQGKEQRARTDVPALVCKKGMFVVDAIERIMRARCGERFFSLPGGVRDRLPRDVSVGRHEERQPWKVCLAMAKSIGMQLFYDGRGVLVLRDVPGRALIDLTPTRPIAIDYDWGSMFNRVEVTGSRKVKATKTTKARTIDLDGGATAGPYHPLNPTKMGRNGVPWQHTLFINDSKIATNRQAERVADSELARVISQSVKVTGSAVPVWHLDPRDKVTLGGEVVSLEDAAFPLSGGDMTIGDTNRVGRPHR